MHSSLYIATPLYDGKVSHLYTLGAIDLAKTVEARYGFLVGSYIGQNRERLTRDFLRSECSHLLWIDSDIGWVASDVFKLLAAELEVVSGVYTKRQIKKEIPAQPLDGDELAIDGQIVECEALPAGFLLMRREVITKILEQYPSVWEHSLDVGEDLAFSRRWRLVGGKLFLHTGVLLRHIGETSFEV